MKVEFEKCPLPLFLLKARVIDELLKGKVMEVLVLVPAPLQLKVQLLRAVLRAQRGQESW